MTTESAIIAAAESALSSSLGVPIHFSGFEVLKGSDRSIVRRCHVVETPNAPRSVVVKQVLGDDKARFNPADNRADGPAWRLFNDWGGADFLTRVAEHRPPGPRFYGGDRDAGFIVVEDLGLSDTMADLLLGTDAAQAEAALISFSATLGRMHALTVGKSHEYDELRGALGQSDATTSASLAQGDLNRHVRRFLRGCEALGVRRHAALEDELDAVLAAMRDPGPFLAYMHGDPCPDNAIAPDGDVRLVDFEFGRFGHALLDATYGRMPFPTCWCVNRLPVAIPARMELAYRAELVKGCPEASDDGLFYRELVMACARWMITTTASLLKPALTQDAQWGIATLRQRVLMRLDAFVQVAEEFGYLDATVAAAAAMAARARTLWPPEANEVPLYPAFR